jgi:signal transduction histidine kinase
MPAAPVSPAPAARSAQADAIPLHRSSVDLARLAESTLEPLKREAKTLDIALGIEAPGDLQSVVVDPEKIAWVIATLVGNAMRYVRRGTRCYPGGAVVVRIGENPAGREVSISVEDDGPGIPEDKVPYLFERKAGSQHAIGLALTLVHDIVAAHGGTVRVESSTDGDAHGTKVHVALPV